jgi:predicted DNA-binding protein (MmcQ/YjbR family)
MTTDARDRAEARFWRLAEPLLAAAGVTRSTMMGFPCLRLQGDFFACCDRRTGDLVVKLDERRASELLASGRAEPFAPNGRRFREWVTIPHARHRAWSSLLDEALGKAAERTGSSRSRRAGRAPRARRVRSMSREDVLGFCAGMTDAVEDYPFGDGVAVFKVRKKMFALVTLDGDPGFVNLKCDPDLALELRTRHAAVRPGYHTNKRHWNSVDLDGSIERGELEEMIEHSYELVVDGLPRAERAALRDG